MCLKVPQQVYLRLFNFMGQRAQPVNMCIFSLQRKVEISKRKSHCSSIGTWSKKINYHIERKKGRSHLQIWVGFFSGTFYSSRILKHFQWPAYDADHYRCGNQQCWKPDVVHVVDLENIAKVHNSCWK